MPQLTSVHDAADLVSSSPSRSNHNSYRAAKQSSPCPPYRPAAPSANDCGSYDTPAETRRAVEKPRLAQGKPINTPAPCRIVLKRRLIRLVDRIHIYCSL